MKKIILALLAQIAIGCCAHAQAPAAGQLRGISEDEAGRLRSELSQPPRSDGTEDYYRTLENSAARLGDERAREVILRTWMAALPGSAIARNNLASFLRNRGELEQVPALRAEAVERSQGIAQVVFRVRLASDLVAAHRLPEASTSLRNAENDLQQYRNQSWTKVQVDVHRAQCEIGLVRSVLAERQGQWKEALRLASGAEVAARQALRLSQQLSGSPEDTRYRNVIAQDIPFTLSRQVTIARQALMFSEADAALQRLASLGSEVELRPEMKAMAFLLAADLNFARRDFVQSEAFARQSEEVLIQLGYEPGSHRRLQQAAATIRALSGQRKWQEAGAYLDGLGSRETPSLQFQSGLVFLHTNRFAESAEALEKHVANESKLVDDSNHLRLVIPSGLRGVALWKSSEPTSVDLARDLLRKAAGRLVEPADLEQVTEYGDRGYLRDLILATYLESVAANDQGSAVQAIKVADAFRAGKVQQAMSDAAARAAISDPGLERLVREDQELRNSIASLLDHMGTLSGEGAKVAAGRVRRDLSDLRAARQKLRSELEARFPRYFELTRAQPASIERISSSLASHEALVLFLPTEHAILAWAVESSGQARFERVPVRGADMHSMIAKIRSTLDFAAMGAVLRPFDHRSAYEVYRDLLEPLNTVIAGKRNVIVVATGVLSHLPFAVLPTSPDATKPAWLMEQMALTHAPSAGAWLASKIGHPSSSGQDPLIAWGDPDFSGDGTRSSAKAVRNVSLARPAGQEHAGPPSGGVPTRQIDYAKIPPLPETREELLAIAASLGADPARDLLMGAHATRASVMDRNATGELRRKRVLVFATHGLIAGDLPGLHQPALALAAMGSRTDILSNLLTLEDVLQLKLNADWVILSACNSASNDGRAEEALSGLARAFIFAGTRSLLVTHWAVDSESAKAITTRALAFYSQNPAAGKAESLRQGMLELMKKEGFSHPAYWAPYVFVGSSG